MLPVLTKYQYSINPNEGLGVWQYVSPSEYIPDAPSKLLRTGRFARNLDILSGWNVNDGTEFVVSNITTDAEVVYQAVKPGQPGYNTTKELLSLYPLSQYAPVQSGNNTATAQFFRAAEMFRDLQFLCPALFLEKAMSEFSTKPVTSSLYNMNTTIYGPGLAKSNETYLGIAHGSEVAFVFDTIPGVKTASTAQQQLGVAMSASWSAFASSGNVTHGMHTIPGWTESYTGKDSTYNVRVISGPNNGMASISAAGHSVLDEGSQDLPQRCAFWNSETVQEQLQLQLQKAVWLLGVRLTSAVSLDQAMVHAGREPYLYPEFWFRVCSGWSDSNS